MRWLLENHRSVDDQTRESYIASTSGTDVCRLIKFWNQLYQLSAAILVGFIGLD